MTRESGVRSWKRQLPPEGSRPGSSVLTPHPHGTRVSFCVSQSVVTVNCFPRGLFYSHLSEVQVQRGGPQSLGESEEGVTSLTALGGVSRPTAFISPAWKQVPGAFMADKAFPPTHRRPRLAHLARVFWCRILRFGRDVCTVCLSGGCRLLSGAAHTWGEPGLWIPNTDCRHWTHPQPQWPLDWVSSTTVEPRKHLGFGLPRALTVNASDGRQPVPSGGVCSRPSGSQNPLPR